MRKDKPESLLNIGFVCAEHAPKPGKYAGRKPDEFLNKFVKLGFPSPQGIEHMWIHVERLGSQGTELEGILDNDPVNDVGFSYGDDIGFDVSEIEDVVDE